MEALVLIIPPIVALLIGAWAILAPRPLDPVAERTRLDQHVARLEESLARARTDNWDEQMISNLLDKLADARREQNALQVA